MSSRFQFCEFHFFLYSEVHFVDLKSRKAIPIRDVKATHIGKLVTVRGVVMRCTEVKPMMSIATYCCSVCSSETYQPVSTNTRNYCNKILRKLIAVFLFNRLLRCHLNQL